MSEFLYRGYNVALPAVDIGDDVYVVEDRLGTMHRVQVKTSDWLEENRGAYLLSRQQLRTMKASELFFMFMTRWWDRWRFILIPRVKLAEIRDSFEQQDRAGKPGRRPVADATAKTDALVLNIDWGEADAWGWGTSFAEYLDRWPDTFPESREGPGTVRDGDRSRDP